MSAPKTRRGGQYGKAPQPGGQNGATQGANGSGGTAGLTGKALVKKLASDYLKLKNGQNVGDYTDDNNPDLITYQQKEDDKTANFLASTDRDIDYNDPKYADGYPYHDLDLNKLLLRLNINKKPTVLSKSDFKDYLKQTGQQEVYRGWSGQAAIDRFKNADHNHVGNGWAGDGYYFSPDRSTAASFANGRGNITRMALSPTARVISLKKLNNMLSNNASPKLQAALNHAGNGTGGFYGTNNGASQYALKLGYNVVDMGGGYLFAITRDAFVVSQ